MGYEKMLHIKLSMDTITFERISVLDCALAYFFRTKKERTSLLASHIGQKFKKLQHFSNFENHSF